jgi:hypothetical protein
MNNAIWSRWSQNRARFITQIGILIYVAVSGVYLFFGQINGDEGWYLYASKLVFQGALPFRDFAFTQMPLSPYIYGVGQSLDPGLILGRLTSILISIGTVLMSIRIARRYAGAHAGAIVATLFATFTLGIYYNSIVKTYALLAFFFTATLFALSSDLDETIKHPLALLYAFLAMLVRVSAAAFLAPIWFYVFIVARKTKTRVLILIESAIIAGVNVFFLLPDWQSARWDLFDSHLRHWAGADLSSRIVRVLTDRVPDVIQNFAPALVLFAASLYFIACYEHIKPWATRHLDILATTIGLGLFAASHLVNGLWDIEYLAPAMSACLPILAILLGNVYNDLGAPARIFAQGALVATLILFPLNESIQHIDISGKRLPVEEIFSTANFVAQHTQPSDRIVALEGLNVVVDANRNTLPGLDIAQFSVQRMDTPTAQRLHVVNAPMLAAMVQSKSARMVILSDRDWGVVRAADQASADVLQDALTRYYNLVLTVPQFGQYGNNLSIYLISH